MDIRNQPISSVNRRNLNQSTSFVCDEVISDVYTLPRETFQGLIPDKHSYDIDPSGKPFQEFDVHKYRENLVNIRSPLETLREARIGESTPLKWSNHHSQIHNKTEALLNESGRLCLQSRDVSSQSGQETENQKQVVTNSLDNRVKSTLNRRESLLNTIQQNILEWKLLCEIRERLHKGLEELELPEKNNEECVNIRSKRQGVDRTCDSTTLNLEREAKILATNRRILTDALSQTNKAIAQLLEIKRLLEHDWSDKQETMQIDHHAAKLHVHPISAHFKAVSAALDEGCSNPATWLQKSVDHETICQNFINNTTLLREAANIALKAMSEDVRRIDEETDATLSESMNKLEESISNITEDDSKIRQDIAQLEQNISLLRQSLIDKESPFQVSQTRHWERSYRPGTDRCIDEAHLSLQNELQNIAINIDKLRQLLSQSEQQLENLYRQHEDLLSNKLAREHTLSLETRCSLVRSTKPSVFKLQGMN